MKGIRTACVSSKHRRYEADDCVGLINGAIVKVKDNYNDQLVDFGTAITSNKGKSRRSQTYRVKGAAFNTTSLTFSKAFHLAELKIYGGKLNLHKKAVRHVVTFIPYFDVR